MRGCSRGTLSPEWEEELTLYVRRSDLPSTTPQHAGTGTGAGVPGGAGAGGGGGGGGGGGATLKLELMG
eukprot:3273885-Rhodomonas_salina.1